MRLSILILVGLGVFLGSCSRFRKIQKSVDWRVKYEAALDYYESGDYYRAVVLLEEIMPFARTEKEGEKALFYYAYCYYNYKNQYLLASHYFKNFYQTYNRSEFAQEAYYMHAYCLYLDSPLYNLDQTSTNEAISTMQNFLNRYPDSEYSEKATAIIDELQIKLEKKAYENSRQYYRLSKFKSAVIAFENFENGYPDSEYIEEVRFLKIDAQYNLAKLSIYTKQKERFLKAIEYYEEFVERYPESSFLKTAQNIYGDSQSELRKLAKIEKNISNL
jgi:outer membrane protein assembly factor BamD